MPADPLVVAPLLLALVLLASGTGKLRAPERARAAVGALDLPAPLRSRAAVAAHPWAELVLAILVLALPGPLGLVAAVAVLVLLLGYLGLVVRAWLGPEDVDCACFGTWGADRVTGVTVVRNTWLAVLGVLAVVRAAADGRSPLVVLGGLDPAGWGWLGAAAAAALTVALVLGRPSPRPEEGPTPLAAPSADGGAGADLGDYLRIRTPAVPVTLADGSTRTLRELARARAQLLLFVSEQCGACTSVIEAAPGWRERLAALEVRLVLPTAPDSSRLVSTSEPMTLHDPRRWARETLGLDGTPAAVLLGADGLLAGGPVSGRDEVVAFVEEIAVELAPLAHEQHP